MKCKPIIKDQAKNDIYNYEIKPALKHGKRTVKILVKDGEYAGKSAFIIKMPESISGFFPQMQIETNASKT